MIGERRAVDALLAGRPLTYGDIEVEVRASPPTTDPRSGTPVRVPPVVILWVAERPVAVRLRTILALSRFPHPPRLASLLEADAPLLGLAIERMCEAGLWRLFSRPPGPRLVPRFEAEG